MSPNVPIYSVIFAVAVIFFGWTCYRRFRLLRLGKAEDRFSNVGRRIKNMLVYSFGQRRVVSKKFGLNHFVIFWSFIILLLANGEFLLSGLFPDYLSYSELPNGAFYTLCFIFDVVSALALVAVLFAVIRRAFFSPPHIGGLSRDASIILAMIGILMLAFFGLRGAQIAQGGDDIPKYAPISSFVSTTLFDGASKNTLSFFIDFFWWVHAIVLLSFMNYLPYSKHMHIMTAIPNTFLKSLDKVNTQQPEEFKKGNVFGVERVDQFTWKALFDSYSCTECGRCSDICPATSTNKHLDPRLVIHDIKVNLLKNGPQLCRNGKSGLLPVSLIGGGREGSISEEIIWECTTCGACMEVCPVFIEHVPKIVEMRRNLVEMKARFPEELNAFFGNIEQRSNPWGIAPSDRSKLIADLAAVPFEAGKTEYLFYVGCAGSFDACNRQATIALAKILSAAGISWGILGKEEMCCGDSLRRLGNEYVFDQMAKKNVELFKAKGIQKIITQCPHCFSTLKNDYRQYGASIDVVHHTELIDNLIRQGRLKLKNNGGLKNVVFHDSCYLGRYNMIYDAPRRVLTSVTGKTPLEMKNNASKSFCCGAGGGHMWMEEPAGKRINVARVEEAMACNGSADTICVCCPYCMTMFKDGLKDKKIDDRVQVLDIAEIVSKALV